MANRACLALILTDVYTLGVLSENEVTGTLIRIVRDNSTT
ncbi:unnamed protein product [Ixodes pacificus]